MPNIHPVRRSRNGWSKDGVSLEVCNRYAGTDSFATALTEYLPEGNGRFNQGRPKEVRNRLRLAGYREHREGYQFLEVKVVNGLQDGGEISNGW